MTNEDQNDLPTVDLTECENEPIHLLERVQSHGCLLVLDGAPLVVTQASMNTDMILGEAVEAILDRPVTNLLDPACVTSLECLRDQTGPPDRTPLGLYARPETAAKPVPRLRVTARRVPHPEVARLLVEIEPISERDEEEAEHTFEAEGIALAGLTERENLYQFLDQAVHALAGLTDYDRVMAYIFHPDWSGEVAAEARHPELTPFLGLRYPASDIPSQARRLYLSNRLRMIGDVNGVTVPIARAGSVQAEPPLDLGHAHLRSVSSYHIEYLRNMGVGATLVTSLIIDGALWGLLACHHSERKVLSWHRREAADRLTGRISERIGDILDLQRSRQDRRSGRFLDMLKAGLVDHGDALDALFFGAPRLSDVIRCDGLAIHTPGRTATTGNTPLPSEMTTFLARALEHNSDGLFISHDLHQDGMLEGIHLPGCRGTLVAFLSRDPMIALACFRDEVVREVHWGGDPNKPVEIDQSSQRLSPRKSFNLWREEVRGQSRPWEPWAIDLMERIATALTREPSSAANSAPPSMDVVADEVASLREAVDTMVSRFEARAESMLESLDLAENGALLATPWQARTGTGTEDMAIASNHAFRIRFDIDEGDLAGRSVKTVLRALGLPGTIATMPPGGTMEVEWWSGEAGHRSLRVLRRGLFAVSRDGEDKAWVIYTFNDITNFYRTQKALGVARTQAMARTRGRTEFLAHLARELRGPLHAIQGFADTLTEDPGEGGRTDRYKDYASEIRGLSGNLLDLLNEVLDIARLDRDGHHTSGPGNEFDLTLMVGEICQQLRASRSGDAITWDWHLPNERIVVRGDVGAMHQALVTLIAAALRASPSNGVVSVRLTMERGGEPRVSVSDSGLGLGEDDLIALRRPLDTTLGRDSASLSPQRGLGLALVRGLVDLHGGGVAVTSNPGSGTTVHVTLPRHRVVSHDNAAAGSPTPGRRSPP